MSLAKRLKELRKVKKISQRELAKILKISSGAVGMYETGKREPDYELLCKIADYFGVTTDYIFCRTDDPAPPQSKKDGRKILFKRSCRLGSSDGFPYSVHFEAARKRKKPGVSPGHYLESVYN